MGRIKTWIRKLERANQTEEIIIPQKDGTVARFPKASSPASFLHEANRLRAIHRGEDPGEAHPLTTARRNARHPEGVIFDADKQPRRFSG